MCRRWPNEPDDIWCERRDSNPHGFTRQILSLVRLPIPPLSPAESRRDTKILDKCDTLIVVSFTSGVSSFDDETLADAHAKFQPISADS